MTLRTKTWRDLAPRVKTLVERNFSSQREFAKLLGQQESTVSQWLSGTRNPRFDMAIRVVGAAGASMAELLGEESESVVIARELAERMSALERQVTAMAPPQAPSREEKAPKTSSPAPEDASGAAAPGRRPGARRPSSEPSTSSRETSAGRPSPRRRAGRPRRG